MFLNLLIFNLKLVKIPGHLGFWKGASTDPLNSSMDPMYIRVSSLNMILGESRESIYSDSQLLQTLCIYVNVCII